MNKQIDLKALFARIQAEKTEKIAKQQATVEEQEPIDEKHTTTGMHGELITYNKEQQKFINLVSEDKSCVLIGAAGTGKTTCSQGALKALIQNKHLPIMLDTDGHKHLLPGTPGVAIISYTRRAVNNIRKVQSEDLKPCCLTAHKLLEYEPVFYQIEDEETGKVRTTMRFEPSRSEYKPLPTDLHTIVVEEASMLGIDIFEQIIDALSHPVQWIFIGDIQQLPPVFGPAILGFKMNELPVIELTQVYRQALESPIIRLAHRVLSGEFIPLESYKAWYVKEKLTIHPWKKKLSADLAVMTLAAFFKKGIDTKLYNPEEDIILIPYNKACGTLELNKHIANHLARKRGSITHEVVAGFIKHYLSEGDKVLFDRADAEIVEIRTNSSYTGMKYQAASPSLDYWGHNPNAAAERAAASPYASRYDGDDEIDADFLLDQAASSDERVQEASHKIVVRLLDSETEVTLSKAGELNTLIHGYALTVHKAQGSEWNKVFLAFHQSHATMMQRELLYTAITRAREELYVICEPETFTKGIISQRIKGNTLSEKAEFFKGKQKENGSGRNITTPENGE